MFLPKLNQIKKKTQAITGFKGLNERASIADNEFSDCCNVSMKEYPALSVRDGYSIFKSAFGYNRKNLYVKAKRNLMILDEGAQEGDELFNHTITLYAETTDASGNREIKEGTVYTGSGNKRVFRDFDVYNGAFVMLFESPNWPNGICVLEEGEIVSDDETFDEALIGLPTLDEKSGVGLMAFGSRLILLAGTNIHISFDNDISAEKWTTYSIAAEDGTVQETAECAQSISLLDDGDFIGCVNYRDYPVFFKENSMYILYGEYTPFSLSRIDMVGCVNKNTIAICNGKLYFLSKLGVMEYDGGVPQLISQDIDIDIYSMSNRYACADDRHYYIGHHVYDTYTQTWSKQRMELDVFQPQCYFGGNLYVADDLVRIIDGRPFAEKNIYRSDPSVSADWSFTTNQFHEYQEGKKLISNLVIGFENESATALKIEVSLDKKAFRTVYTWDGTTDFAKEVPVILPPCDYFQLRVSGTGKLLVHYIKREYRVLGG